MRFIESSQFHFVDAGEVPVRFPSCAAISHTSAVDGRQRKSMWLAATRIEICHHAIG
jgi:hypothetical protein